MKGKFIFFIYTIIGVISLIAFTSCGTLVHSFIRVKPDYTSLPQEDLLKTAQYIEEKIWAGEREPDVSNLGINLDTPQIKQAIRTRAVRHELIKDLLDKGFVYEQNSGLIAIQRNSSYKKSTTRQQRDKNALVVMGENSDRWALYEGIVKANNYPPKSLSAIQDSFYRARTQCLQQGHKYQTPDGKITQK
ncbi:MAG TPA: DUF1318 domain-containing protein [Candidatus Hydrogenedens sp.]|nr:DUF1318 domain-containing protein [Candidatus Hydrogenedens sp.]HOL20786.1 DUF1318 domain-containing protein [Candidatus Hydrogenedens sp.]